MAAGRFTVVLSSSIRLTALAPVSLVIPKFSSDCPEAGRTEMRIIGKI
jgi:hypothetical protein